MFVGIYSLNPNLKSCHRFFGNFPVGFELGVVVLQHLLPKLCNSFCEPIVKNEPRPLFHQTKISLIASKHVLFNVDGNYIKLLIRLSTDPTITDGRMTF